MEAAPNGHITVFFCNGNEIFTLYTIEIFKFIAKRKC